jgi:hypothetical protein
MGGLTVAQDNSPAIPAACGREKTSDDNLAVECRNLIAVLSRKIEKLCNECGEDPDQAICIRSLTASLTTLNSLVKTLEQERVYASGMGLFEDARGISYVSVRYCDLERFSAK